MKMKFIAPMVLAISLSISGVSQERMTPEKLWDLGRVGGEGVSPDGAYVYYGVTRYDVGENKGSRDLFRIPTKGGKAEQLTNTPGSEYGVQFHPNGKKIGYMLGGQMWEADLDGKNASQITNIEGGISSFKYSPSGEMVAYTAEVKTGKTLADDYPNLPKAEARIIDDLMYRHWDHWEDEMRSHVFVADYKNGSVSNAKDIMAGEPYDCPLQPFGGSEDYVWSPNGTKLAYVSKKLTGVKAAESTNSDIYMYDIASGATENISQENPGYDMHPSFSPDGEHIAWLTMRTPGYESDVQSIRVMNVAAKQMIKVGMDWDNTVTGFTWEADGNSMIINAGEDATYQLYRAQDVLNPETVSSITRFTEGQHNIGGVIGIANGKVFASKTDMNHAAEIYSYAITNGKEKKLTTVNDKIYSSIDMSRVEKKMVETVDGQQMLVWVIFPPNFDESKTYPSLLYCQGGPQSAVSQFYSFRWNFQLMAANDYIIIAPNRRGLPTFGEEWNRSISGDWGGMPMQDYMRAVEVMREEPYIDPSRVGAVGASYGGYSVYMLAGMHGGMFCSFISHCGLFNLESWYGVTEELFFANFDIGGPYWNNPTPPSYERFSPHKFVQNWDTPMLVIHGGNDFRVPINQGMEAFQAAKIKGLKTKFLYYPNEGHWVLQPQNGLLWHSEFFKWLDETVKNK